MSTLTTFTTKPSFSPHFAGEYGSEALVNLSDWMSSLFTRSMVSLREATREACAANSMECHTAKTMRRAEEPRQFQKYDMFDPFVHCPGGVPVQRMGGLAHEADDGGKWLCMTLLQPPCTIFSLGSNGDFSFEESMLNATECAIHTFDCTYDGASVAPGRHAYHKLCMGSAAKAAQDSNFVTLTHAAEIAGVSKINLLKIDIEGFEYDVLSAWSQADVGLPEQIAIEVHHSEVIYAGTAQGKDDDFSNLLWPLHNLGQSDLALFFGHLGGLGYGIASREDNRAYGTCCSEFLLLKVGDWARNPGRQ